MANGEQTFNNVKQNVQLIAKDMTEDLKLLWDNTIASLSSSSVTLTSPEADNLIKSGDMVDVWSNGLYKWTTEDLTYEQTSLIPYIEMDEYEITANGLWSTVNYITQQLKNFDHKNPYNGLYLGKKTGRTFRFPYFQNLNSQRITNWSQADSFASATGLNDASGGLLGKAETFLKNAIGMGGTFANMSNRFNITKPMIWQGTNISYQITVNFKLYNTIGGSNSYVNNIKLINYLKLSSSFDQKNAFCANPPAIYTLQIPGVVWFPAAYIQNLTITNVGNVTLHEGSPVPDAFDINMSIAAMVPQSRIVTLDGLKTSNDHSITAITDETSDDAVKTPNAKYAPSSDDIDASQSINQEASKKAIDGSD